MCRRCMHCRSGQPVRCPCTCLGTCLPRVHMWVFCRCSTCRRVRRVSSASSRSKWRMALPALPTFTQGKYEAKQRRRHMSAASTQHCKARRRVVAMRSSLTLHMVSLREKSPCPASGRPAPLSCRTPHHLAVRCHGERRVLSACKQVPRLSTSSEALAEFGLFEIAAIGIAPPG